MSELTMILQKRNEFLPELKKMTDTYSGALKIRNAYHTQFGKDGATNTYDMVPELARVLAIRTINNEKMPVWYFMLKGE